SRGVPATCGSAVRKACAARARSGEGSRRKRFSSARSRAAEAVVKPYMEGRGNPETRTQKVPRTQRTSPAATLHDVHPTATLPDGTARLTIAWASSGTE